MKTIKAKVITFVTGILLSFILASIMLNALFLERYYVYKAKDDFLKVYDEVKAELFEADKNWLVRAGARTGFEINIVDNNMKIISTSKITDKNVADARISASSKDKLAKLENEYYYAIEREGDKREIIFLATLKSNYLVIKKPMRALTESASIANVFFIISGLILFILSVILLTILSKHFLTPLNEINEIVSRISKLDFSKKFVSKTEDEINDLGENINIISEKLSTTIEELKDSNAKLSSQIESQKLFFATTSHEFKTPLGLIRGYSEAIQLDLADKTDLTETIISEVDRLNLLVNDITELISFDRADFKLKLSREDLAFLLKDRIKKFSGNIQNKNINLILEAPHDLSILIDKNRILQLLDNLLSNAINYVDKNKIIEIKLNRLANKAVISFYNSSDYINKETLDKLFMSFYRIDKDRSRLSGGSGLGLAIVKKIVLAHGGECSIRNYKNGILLEIFLPLKNASQS